MNTKAFVNGFDPENTVKGYYDENDQLVLVEPEGSGGGDVVTFELRTQGINAGESETAYVPHIELYDETNYAAYSYTFLPAGDEVVEVLPYNGKAVLDLGETPSFQIELVSGDADVLIPGLAFMLKGDCVFKKAGS